MNNNMKEELNKVYKACENGDITRINYIYILFFWCKK